MATERKLYFTNILYYLLDCNHCHGTPLSRENLQKAFSRVMEDNVNNVTIDTLVRSPVTIHAQKKDANMTNERQISADIHAETMKECEGFFIQSTISDAAHSDYDELVYAIIDSKELVNAAIDSK